MSSSGRWLAFGIFLLAMVHGRADALLSDDLKNEVDSRIKAAGPFDPSKLEMFSHADDSTGAYVRNPGVWTGSIDLSGIGVHVNQAHGSKQIGTLITPADVVMANHFRLNPGDVITFIDPRNVRYDATVIALINVTQDVTVEHVTWRRRVPTTLKILPILPPDFRHYLPPGRPGNFPVLCTNQARQVFVRTGAPSPSRSDIFFHFPARDPLCAPFSLPIVIGDSSQPIMAVVKGAAVLITCNTTASWGISYPDNFDAINQGLATMGSRWRATAANLSGFRSY